MFEPHVNLFEDGLTRRSPKLAQRAFAPALASRGAYLRPRKLDEKLSKHGLGARRVALLAPRATFDKYWYPLDYLYARLKLFQKGMKSISRILGGMNSIPSGGGVPKGRRGYNITMLGDVIPKLN